MPPPLLPPPWNIEDILRGVCFSDTLTLKPGGHEGSGHVLMIATTYL